MNVDGNDYWIGCVRNEGGVKELQRVWEGVRSKPLLWKPRRITLPYVVHPW